MNCLHYLPRSSSTLPLEGFKSHRRKPSQCPLNVNTMVQYKGIPSLCVYMLCNVSHSCR
uniref:Phosphoglucan phosphatase DSP4 amyloplastic n=1 Tax=Rhizophora mucronata TaxID=61149 RepID=A0A2P2KIP2_RHIMU